VANSVGFLHLKQRRMNEIWKDIPGYEGLYQVSNLGVIKSLSRKIFNNKYYRITKDKLLKIGISKHGYCNVELSKNCKRKNFKVHQLVAMAFLNHTPCGFKLVVDHINDNKIDNRLENLQVVTTRYNSHKTQVSYSSNHKGVSWDSRYKKWRSVIHFNKKYIHLGYFNCELQASEAYQNKLKEII